MRLISYNIDGYAFVQDGEVYIWICYPYSMTEDVDFKAVEERIVAGSFILGDFIEGPATEFINLSAVVTYVCFITAKQWIKFNAGADDYIRGIMIEQGVDISDTIAVNTWKTRNIIKASLRFLSDKDFLLLLDTIKTNYDESIEKDGEYIQLLLEEYVNMAVTKGNEDMVVLIKKYQQERGFVTTTA